ncbi:MAG: transcriptional repressor [Ottowia sp.]|uniref:Fur family transcriptional regulator n=1 Tax=Ottowia sp. TaxID=1898956 RepID=UPI0039E33A9C
MPRPFTTLPAADDWPPVLRRHGLRATSATLGVLGVMRRAEVPMTHEEIQRAYAREFGAPPDKVTLYRVLERLTGAGLCDTLAGADRRNRFALHASGSGHVFECSCCHKVLPLPDDPELPAALARLGKALKRQGIRAQASAVTLRGTCADCGRHAA